MTASEPVEHVAVGHRLDPLVIDVDATMIVAGAVASRDFEPVHHDRRAATAGGLPDIFLNILSTNGLVVRYVTDWAGPDVIVRKSAIRLGVPHCAGERLTLSGEVVVLDGPTADVAVRGSNARGDHVRGFVTIDLPGSAS